MTGKSSIGIVGKLNLELLNRTIALLELSSRLTVMLHPSGAFLISS